MDLALDADAFNFLRALGLLEELLQLARLASPKLTLHSTRYVAKHELSSLAVEIAQLETEGVLTIWAVKTGTPEFDLFKKLQREYDKGESELSAWVAVVNPAAIVVSCDLQVPKIAKKHKFKALDLGEVAIVLVKDGLVPESVMEQRLLPWANPHVGMGRPSWWTTLRDALKRPHPLQ
jgi:hypothetical protein